MRRVLPGPALGNEAIDGGTRHRVDREAIEKHEVEMLPLSRIVSATAITASSLLTPLVVIPLASAAPCLIRHAITASHGPDRGALAGMSKGLKPVVAV